MKKNDVYEIIIEDMSVNGEGIGKIDGFPFFVKDAVIGDKILARVTKLKKNYGFARLETILEASPKRVEPVCAFHRQCGGCQIQALDYKEQLLFKADKVKNHLVRIGKFDEDHINTIMEPVIGMGEPFHYRNKAQFPIGKDKEGNPVAGFYAGRTHHIVPNTDCALGVPVNQEILEIILEYMKTYGVEPYDEETQKGLLRHVLIRYGFYTKEIMVCLVVNGERLPEETALCEKLCKLGGMTSITLNTNKKHTNVILGEQLRLLWGQTYITDELDGISFRISPLSFYQVNPVQTVKLYKKALEYAQLTGEETVWDLYCGIGTISLFLAREAKKVYGVEIVPQAIEDARDNARRNGFDNTEFFVGKAEDVFTDYMKEHSSAAVPDVVVVDPPRKGCDQKLLDTILRMQPKRIVYVSCDSATLARDLEILCRENYQLKKVTTVDQFGQTVHVESTVLLQRRGADPAH